MDDLTKYMMSLMPEMEVECGECLRSVAASAAVEREGNLYCSERCASRACAVLVKPQPKANRVIASDGVVWEV